MRLLPTYGCARELGFQTPNGSHAGCKIWKGDPALPQFVYVEVGIWTLAIDWHLREVKVHLVSKNIVSDRMIPADTIYGRCKPSSVKLRSVKTVVCFT